MQRIATLAIHKEECGFSAGHFTIFSATERETLHGHNYNVSIVFEVAISHNGLSFDYRDYKKKIDTLCQRLNRHLLLPAHSPYLQIEDGGDYWHAFFANKKLSFLKEDTIILPISNVTIEELSYWFLQELVQDKNQLQHNGIQKLSISVFNGPGQSGSAHWKVNDH
jgi:6-pyruvoyltetrahydropterin/6-carboxytetrahydropterin synthase